MIIRFFKSNQPAMPFAIPVLCGLLWLPAFLGFTQAIDVKSSQEMPFFALLRYFTESIPYQFQALIACVIVIVQALYLNHLVNSKEVIHKKSFLPALFYSVLMSFLPSFLALNPVMLASGFILVGFGQLLTLYKSDSPLKTSFNAGFYFAIAALFYFPPIIDFFLLWIALILLLPFNWRGFIAGLVGLFIPFFFTAIYYLWMDNLPAFFKMQNWHPISTHLHFDLNFNIIHITAASFLFILILFSLISLQKQFFKNVIRTRNFQQLILILLFFTVAGVFIPENFNILHLSLFAFPLSILLSHYFYMIKKNWWAETLFGGLIALIVSSYIFR